MTDMLPDRDESGGPDRSVPAETDTPEEIAMPTQTPAPGAPCWIELFTADTASAVPFYCELFGWTATEPSAEHGGYFMFEHDGAPIAGGMRNDGTMGPSMWSVYLHCEDVAATMERATAAGAEQVVAPMRVDDAGYMGGIVDPTGAYVGLWQPLEHPGFVAVAEDGTPGWFELLTTDYDRAVPFYRDVLDWPVHTMSDTPEMRYSTYGEDEDARAGIMDATGMLGGGPSVWAFYLVVPDTDAAVARAQELGGKVDVPAEDTPYGRIAGLLDPTGIPVKVMGPNRAA